MMPMGLDAGTFGLDAATVLAINGVVGWLKEQLATFRLPAWTERLYVALPFGVALLYCLSAEPSLTAAVKCAFLYGAGALVLKNLQRTTLEGR